MHVLKCAGLLYYESFVMERFRITVRMRGGQPEYLFTDRQTGASVSCPYTYADYNETIMELYGLS